MGAQSLRRLPIIVTLLFICIANNGGFAGPYEDGSAAFERGAYATALRLLRPLAEQNAGDEGIRACDIRLVPHAAQRDSCSAQLMYENGQGVAQDIIAAVKWYRAAADRGWAPAQDGLGDFYGWGKGVDQDLTEAAKWYRSAAEQGYSSAQYHLGLMYDNGIGTTQDHKEAVLSRMCKVVKRCGGARLLQSAKQSWFHVFQRTRSTAESRPSCAVVSECGRAGLSGRSK